MFKTTIILLLNCLFGASGKCVDTVADAANASISLLRGDYVGAGVNAVAILPVVGDAFKAGKMVAKGADAAKSIHKTEGGVNLYKWGEDQTKIGGWKTGDRTLYLPDQGTPKLNWQQNSSRLRAEMSQGQPIYDTYVDSKTGLQRPTAPGSFLGAERYLLESHRWIFNPKTGAYHPPR